MQPLEIKIVITVDEKLEKLLTGLIKPQIKAAEAIAMPDAGTSVTPKKPAHKSKQAEEVVETPTASVAAPEAPETEEKVDSGNEAEVETKADVQVYTVIDARKMVNLAREKGVDIEKVRGILSSFGVEKVSQLKDDQFGAFIKKIEELLKKEEPANA